jgi:hypothetical protein
VFDAPQLIEDDQPVMESVASALTTMVTDASGVCHCGNVVLLYVKVMTQVELGIELAAVTLILPHGFVAPTLKLTELGLKLRPVHVLDGVTCRA